MNSTDPTTDAPPTSAWPVRSALLAVQILFGVHYLASKWIVREMEPAAWACLRVVCSLVVLAAIAWLGRRRWPSRRDTWLLGFSALFGIVLNQALFLEGISRTSVGHASLICSQIPLFALLFALLLRQESFTLRKIVGFALGMVGVFVLLEVDRFRLENEFLMGDLLVLANSAAYGLFLVLSRPVMVRNDPLAATTVVFGFGAVGMLIYGLDDLLHADLGGLSTPVVSGMVYSVLGATVLTYFLNYWALKRAVATRVALYIFLQPVVAALLGVLVEGEAVTGRFLVATGLVFCGLCLRGAAGQAAVADPTSSGPRH
ncbi:MAG: DMT family transporter [bacterium]